MYELRLKTEEGGNNEEEYKSKIERLEQRLSHQTQTFFKIEDEHKLSRDEVVRLTRLLEVEKSKYQDVHAKLTAQEAEIAKARSEKTELLENFQIAREQFTGDQRALEKDVSDKTNKVKELSTAISDKSIKIAKLSEKVKTL